MPDILMQSALAYRELMQYRYIFTLERKGEASTVRVTFPESAYHHLAGFHKASFAALRNKSKSLRTILDAKVTAADFAAAGYAFEDRWSSLCHLQDMLESNQAVFRYRGHERADSRIAADYLLQDDLTVFFIADEHPASIFGQKGQHYEQNCPRFTTLQIVRENVDTGEQVVVYRAASYKPLEV